MGDDELLDLFDSLDDVVPASAVDTRFIWTGTAVEQADLLEPIATPVTVGTLR